jgi:hypothetical protein
LDSFQDRPVRVGQTKDFIFELDESLVEIVEHGHVEINELIQNLIEQISWPALAGNRAGAYQLLDVADAAKHVVMIREDEVAAQESVKLNGVEMHGIGIRRDAVQNEVDVIGKFFDLRMMAISAAVFDGKRVKVENVQKNLIVRFGRFLHVHPDSEALVFEQLRQLLDCEILFDLISSGAIDKNIHVNSPLFLRKKIALRKRAWPKASGGARVYH